MTRVTTAPKAATPIMTADKRSSSLATNGRIAISIGLGSEFATITYVSQRTKMAPPMNLGVLTKAGIKNGPCPAKLLVACLTGGGDVNAASRLRERAIVTQP